MFLPAAHVETDQDALLKVVRQNPLGLLITGLPSTSMDFLQCTHVPFVLDAPNGDERFPKGRLRSHIAKQNPQVKAILGAADCSSEGIYEPQQEVLVLFTAKHDHYVTPKYYTETKPSSGKVVPTWNYTAVQAYGRLKLYHDSRAPQTKAFLDKQTDDLSEQSERNIAGHDEPWRVSDAPEKYIEYLQRNIVGIEVEITKLEGKFKMSQEMRVGDREGVIQGFEALKTETGSAIAALVKERGEMKDPKAR